MVGFIADRDCFYFHRSTYESVVYNIQGRFFVAHLIASSLQLTLYDEKVKNVSTLWYLPAGMLLCWFCDDDRQR